MREANVRPHGSSRSSGSNVATVIEGLVVVVVLKDVDFNHLFSIPVVVPVHLDDLPCWRPSARTNKALERGSKVPTVQSRPWTTTV